MNNVSLVLFAIQKNDLFLLFLDLEIKEFRLKNVMKEATEKGETKMCVHFSKELIVARNELNDLYMGMSSIIAYKTEVECKNDKKFQHSYV